MTSFPSVIVIAPFCVVAAAAHDFVQPQGPRMVRTNDRNNMYGPIRTSSNRPMPVTLRKSSRGRANNVQFYDYDDDIVDDPFFQDDMDQPEEEPYGPRSVLRKRPLSNFFSRHSKKKTQPGLEQVFDSDVVDGSAEEGGRLEPMNFYGDDNRQFGGDNGEDNREFGDEFGDDNERAARSITMQSSFAQQNSRDGNAALRQVPSYIDSNADDARSGVQDDMANLATAAWSPPPSNS